MLKCHWGATSQTPTVDFSRTYCTFMRLSNLPIYAFIPSWGWEVASKLQFILQKLSLAKATCGSILQGQTLWGGQTQKCLLLPLAWCPPFRWKLSSRSVVRVSRDHSVVGAQRPGVRVGAVVELRQDPLDRTYFWLMIWIKWIILLTLMN